MQCLTRSRIASADKLTGLHLDIRRTLPPRIRLAGLLAVGLAVALVAVTGLSIALLTASELVLCHCFLSY